MKQPPAPNVFIAAAAAVALSWPAPASAQQFRSYDQCMNALWSRCVSLMDPTAKRNCVKGNVVYCARFPQVDIPEVDKPFSERFPQYEDLEAAKPHDLNR